MILLAGEQPITNLIPILVHISQLSDGYVNNVEEIVHVGQRVRVKVLSVERQRGKWRISLTMKGVDQSH